MSLQGKRMLTFDDVDYTANWVGMESLKPSGPGLVGSANIYLEKVGGGLTVRNKQIVRLWQAWDNTGVGVAPRGRWLIGLVDGRLTTAKGTIAQWKVAVTDCNILLKHLRIDIDDNKAVTIPTGSFQAQVLALTQAVQRQGHANVHIEIDATNYVEPLVASGMPAYVAHGKTFGQMLLEICTNARAINQALRPQFYIGVGSTFGSSDVVGNPVLWVWDGAAAPAPVWVFSDNPSGGQRYRYGTPSRKLDSSGQTTRAQSWWSSSQIPATYENTVAGGSYPNQFINHGLNPGLNSGHWQALDPAKDTTSATLGQALTQIQIAVDQVAYPREMYGHGSDVPVLPGEVVTEIDSLEDGLSVGVNYRVVSVAIDVTSDDDPFYDITLGARRLELLEKGDGILAAPVEGDNSPPLAPTGVNLFSQVWQPLLNAYLQTWKWTNSVSRDVDTHVFQNRANFQEIVYLQLQGQYQRYAAPLSPYDIVVQAVDTHYHWSPDSNEVTGTTPAAPALPPPTSLAQTNLYSPQLDQDLLTFTWTPSIDPSVIHQRLQYQVNGTQYEQLLGGAASTTTVQVPASALIHQARIRAENAYTVSAWEPSTAGLADFTTAAALRLPAPPTFAEHSNVYIPPRNQTQVEFIWSTPSDPNSLGIGGYRLTVNQGGVGYSIILGVITSYIVYMIPGLAYTATVAAIDSYNHVGAASSISGTAAADVHDRLYNPSFEWLEMRPGPTNPDGWAFTPFNGSILWDNSTASDGAYSIRLQWPSGAVPPSITSDYFVLNDGVTYSLDVDAKSSAIEATGPGYTFSFYNSAFAFLGSFSGSSIGALTTSWATLHIGQGIVPFAGTRYATLKFNFAGANSINSHWIDNIILVPQVPTPYVKDLAITAAKLASSLDYLGLTVATKSAAFTLDTTATVYLLAGLSPFTATLPSAVGIQGRIYVIKRTNTSKYTLATTSSQTIDGLATYPFVELNQTVCVYSDGANWRILWQNGLVLESDGTRWLGPEYALPLTTYAGAQPYNANIEAYACAADGLWPSLITRMDVGYFVFTTNSGLSYWNIELRRLTAGGTSSMATQNTSAAAHDTWVHPAPTTTFSNNPTATTDVWIEINLTKTGTPGNMDLTVKVMARPIYS